MPSTQQQHPLHYLPDAQTVRSHLGRLLRETRLTRQLLRLAQAVDEERRHDGQEAAHE